MKCRRDREKGAEMKLWTEGGEALPRDAAKLLRLSGKETGLNYLAQWGLRE